MKKLLLVVPFVVLLAAGCSSSSTNASQTGQSNTQPSSETMASSSLASNKTASGMKDGTSGTMGSAMSGSMWQAALEASNNPAKGNYMITSNGHTIYLKTSRDYSSLVGKPVNIDYSGSLDSFTLIGITAK